MTLSRGLVLHVEDEPGLGELVREMLVADGWQLHWVPTGAQGLEALRKESPQLLLLDHTLPDMLGTQFLDRAAAEGQTLPPFVVTTGMGNEQLAVEMMKRGAADYLVKDSQFLNQIGPVVRRVAHEADLAQRLAQSELQLQFLAQHSIDILAITDREGCPRYLSPAVEAITGYSLAELEHPDEGLVHVADIEMLRSWWKNVTANAGASEPITFRLARRDAVPVWLEAVAQNHLDNPVLQGVIIVARDVTERRVAEQERLEMQRQLLHAQKLESLGVLAGGIAHDFNNLLAVVIGNLDLSLQGNRLDIESRETVGLALKAAERASQLTRQMLAYSGRGTFAIETIDLSALVRENSQIFAVSVSRSIELVTDIAPDVPRILASVGQLQQIVMNLLTNASEALGSGPGRIALSTSRCVLTKAQLDHSLVTERPEPGLFACLAVSDTGCGMPPEVVERLFDPFFTTKRTGRGLGMAAVLGIVRGHGGALFIETAEGKGTTVRVLLPAREGDLASDARTPISNVAPNKLNRTILVVDDDATVRSVAGRLLKSLGCTVREAADGQEALEMAAKCKDLDVILMDLTMPNMGGLEASAKLREMRDCPPVILCSGFGEEGMLGNEVGATGVAAFLEKPFHLAELRAVLEKVLFQR